MTWQFPKMSRRTFLKGSGVGLISTSVFRPQWIQLKGPEKDEISDWGKNWKFHYGYSICNYCSSFCSLRATVEEKNGKQRITKLGGNPRSTLNGDKMCARGQSGHREVYSVDRIKTPLIRVAGSKRGEWSFRSVSWEEAYDYIAEKSRSIKPYEWAVYGGWSTCSFYIPETYCFSAANEIPNLITSPTQNCVFDGHLGTNSATGNYVVHAEMIEDYGNSDFIIICVGNASIGGVSTCRAVRFGEAKEKGAHVVVLDPMASETSTKADEWLQIKPGTDVAFMLAMLREIMMKGLYDDHFVRYHTNLPFLTYRDKNNVLRLSFSKQGYPAVLGDDGKVHYLPAFSNTNQTDIQGIAVVPQLTVPSGFTLHGHPMQTVWQEQLAEIQNYTPEWAETTSEISASTIRRIAHQFASAQRPLLQPGWSGARFGNIQMLRRVMAMIQGMVGGIDRRGGWILGGDYRSGILNMQKHADDPKFPPLGKVGMPGVYWMVDFFTNGKNFSHGFPTIPVAYRDSIDPSHEHWAAWPVSTDVGYQDSVRGTLKYKGQPYQLKAVLINGSNPMRDSRLKAWKEILTSEQMDLVVVMDVMPADTCAYADVILPEDTYLERDAPAIYGNGVNPDRMLITRNRVIEPLYDTKTAPDVFLKLTEIISGDEKKYPRSLEKLAGLPADRLIALTEQNRKANIRDPFNQALRTLRFEAASKELGIPASELEKELREKGVFLVDEADSLLAKASMPWKKPLPTPSGRFEYFSTLYETIREPFRLYQSPFFSVLATYIPPDQRPGKSIVDPLEHDEFYFTFGMVPTIAHTCPDNDFLPLVSINAFRGSVYHGIWIHADRAKKLGIRQGQKIELENLRSGEKVEGQAYVTRLTRPDTLFMYAGFGVKNPALQYAVGIGTPLNAITGGLTEPVSGGTNNQEYTVRVRAL